MKLGISLYSLAREYFDRKYMLEDCIAKSAEIGYEGIEILAPQMIPDYPHPGSEFFDQWHCWMEKYKIKPACLDVFNEYMVLKTRKMTDDEQYGQLLNDMKIANRMGIQVLRVMNLHTPAMLERGLDDADKYDVKFSLEVHGPKAINDPAVYEYLEVADKYRTNRIGICPDLSTFQFTVPPRMLKYYVARGARVDIAEYARQSYNNNVSYDEARTMCEKMGGRDLDQLMVKNVYQGCKSDYNKLRELMPYVNHVHAKCFDELTDEGKDPTYDCETFAAIMKEGGYEGYISAECEAFQYEPMGLSLVTGDLLKQHHDMWRKLISK